MNYIDLDHLHSDVDSAEPLVCAYLGKNAQRITDVIAEYDTTGTFRDNSGMPLPKPGDMSGVCGHG